MFTKEISRITLTNDIADRLFDSITATGFYTDKTFAATLRAVMPERLPADETLHMALVPLDYNAVTPDVIAAKIRQYDFGHSYTIYVVYSQDKNAGKQLLEVVQANFGEGRQYFDTYARQEDLRIFYIKTLEGLFYTSSRSAMIFLDTLDIRRYHTLQTMIPKYLPRLFADKPLSPEETDLLKSLGSKASSEYERLIEQCAQWLDMRSQIIRTRLNGFETAFERARAQEVTQNIAAYQRDYRAYLEKAQISLHLIQEQQIIFAGLQCRINADCGESELMEYFLCNKNLSIIRLIGTELEFVVHGYADLFDEDAFNIYAGNHNSYLYSQISSSMSKEEMEALYRAIFSDGVYKLRLCAAYRADMKNSINPIMDYIFPPESQTYLPNPHIQQYGCIGGYASRFIEYMSNQDYVGAIDQAAVSARNLNFHDAPVMTVFAHNLSCTTIRCVEDVAGNLMTPKEATKKLKEVNKCQNQSKLLMR